MPSSTPEDARKQLARRNVRMAWLHVVLAAGFLALFFYMQVHR